MAVDKDAEKVWHYVQRTYDVTQIFVKASLLLPGGMIVTQRNGTSTMYWYNAVDDRIESRSADEVMGKGFLTKMGTRELAVYNIE